MKLVLLKSAAATSLSIVASIAICWTAIHLSGGQMSWFPVQMSVLCSVLIGFPVSCFTFIQNHRVSRAHLELKEAHLELADLYRKVAASARIDAMTHLLNRGAFIDDIDKLGRLGHGGAFLLVDIDNFKSINDTFGHLVGDRAISTVAGCIQDIIGQRGISARIGGEEFAVFLKEVSLPAGLRIANELRESVEGIFFRANPQNVIPLRVSVGVSWSSSGAGFETLMAEADEQLYNAKRSGRNRVCAKTEDVRNEVRMAINR